MSGFSSKKIIFSVIKHNPNLILKFEGVKFLEDQSKIIASFEKKTIKVNELINYLNDKIKIIDISSDEGDLEDVFVKLTKN